MDFPARPGAARKRTGCTVTGCRDVSRWTTPDSFDALPNHHIKSSAVRAERETKAMNSETTGTPAAADNHLDAAVAADENRLIAERREKLRALRAAGIAFPNDFVPDAFAGDLQTEFADKDQWTAEAIEALGRRVRVAGRLLAKRQMGKASFAQVQDMSARLQLFLQQAALGDDAYAAFKGWDVGDIIGAEGL